MIDETPQVSPLQRLHETMKAQMGTYDGTILPAHYPSGMEVEHLHTRQKAGLFDISHLGQIRVRAKEGNVAIVAEALETLLPMNILDLGEGRLIYGLLTTDQGGIRDDLIISRQADDFLLMLNGRNKEINADYIENALGEDCKVIRQFDRATVTLQGPSSAGVLSSLLGSVADMKYRDSRDLRWHDGVITVSRFGYTGMDGFDICLPADLAESFARSLLDHPDVEPAGMEARNSLRLEAGLCLYGVDIDKTTSPVEASLVSNMQLCRRPGGERAGGYPGAETIEGQLEHGVYRRRVGFEPDGEELLAGGVELFSDEAGQDKVGRVTSGCFGPTLRKMIGMGYVTPDHAEEGTRLFAAVGEGVMRSITVRTLPFVSPTIPR